MKTSLRARLVLVVALAAMACTGETATDGGTRRDAGPTALRDAGAPLPGDCATADCGDNATCSIESDRAVCRCDEGYSGDGHLCQEIVPVGGCDALPAIGAWEAITPSAFTLPGPERCPFGTQDVALDPLQPGVLYLGTCEGGIYRSADCGASWTKINTGTDGPPCAFSDRSCAEALDTGRQWNLVIDPTSSSILYAANGFAGNGVSGMYKSVDGGVHWRVIWPIAEADPRFDESLRGTPGFVGGVQIDPENHEHLLMSFHESCGEPYTSLCLVESEDGGEHWSVVNGDEGMRGYSPHDTAFAMVSGELWYQNTQGADTAAMWRSDNGGETWTELSNTDSVLGQMLLRADGSMLVGGTYGVYGSADGIEWTKSADSRFTGSFVELPSGTVVRSDWNVCATAFLPDGNANPYSSSPDGANWTSLPSPAALHQGGALNYDAFNHVLYSTNCQDGFWRVRLE